jgi:RNA polymerase sigma-70 factor, ECF subfamily
VPAVGLRGAPAPASRDLARQRKVVEAFLAALRAGDLEGLVAVLDPDVVFRTDVPAAGAPVEIRGARAWAKAPSPIRAPARFLQPVLVDGAVGLVLAPRGKLVRVLHFQFARGKIARAQIIADPARLRTLRLAVLAP